MKKPFNVVNIIMIAIVLISNAIYISSGNIELKGVTSGLFALMGFINLIYAIVKKNEKLTFSIFIFLGLISSMLGDILITGSFITGAALFGVGHLMYLIAYFTLAKISSKDVIFSASIFAAVALFMAIYPSFNFGGLDIVCYGYALIISCMVGKALGNHAKLKNTLSLVIAIGSVLFALSDVMLLFYVFGGAAKIVDYICICAYYPAQSLLAYSISRTATYMSPTAG